MTTAIMVALGLLFTLLYLNGVVTAEDSSCACQEEVNKALIRSLKGCTDALTAIEECDKEPTIFNQARKVKMEAQAVAAATSCECAKKVTEALTKSLKSCVEALSESISCSGPSASTAVPPTTSSVVSPSSTTVVPTSFIPSPSPSPPAKSTSCKEILEKDPTSKTGSYTLYDPITEEEYQVTCLMTSFGPCNNIAGLTILLSKHYQNTCPKGLVLKEFKNGKICVRPPSESGGCISINIPTHNIQYDRVCGAMHAFQIGTPDGISGPNRPGTIDDAYVDGVSLTHGKSPRKHIWTFMGSSSEKKPICPCATGSTVKVPDFIGNNYFCESGNPEETAVAGKIYSADKLWDMENCRGVEASCVRKGKNYHYYAVLPSSTTDDIEVRVCSDEATSDEDFAVLALAVAIY